MREWLTSPPKLFFLGMLAVFLLGDLLVPIGAQNNFWITGNFSFLQFTVFRAQAHILLAQLFGFIASVYYTLPRVSGRPLNTRVGQAHFLLSAIFAGVSLYAAHRLGLLSEQEWQTAAGQQLVHRVMLALKFAFFPALAAQLVFAGHVLWSQSRVPDWLGVVRREWNDSPANPFLCTAVFFLLLGVVVSATQWDPGYFRFRLLGFRLEGPGFLAFSTAACMYCAALAHFGVEVVFRRKVSEAIAFFHFWLTFTLALGMHVDYMVRISEVRGGDAHAFNGWLTWLRLLLLAQIVLVLGVFRRVPEGGKPERSTLVR